MADFDVVIVQTIDPARVTSAAWVDPPIDEDPTRLNPRGHVQHRYARVDLADDETTTLELDAVVAGVQAPADGTLSGRLFGWSVGLGPPGAPIPLITSPVGGKTARASIALSGHYHPGHWVITCARPSGGHVGIPFDVEPPP